MFISQDRQASTIQRCRPSRCEDSTPAPADLGPQRLLVVGLVGVQFRGPLAGSATPGAHRRDGVEQGQHQLGVGRVRGGDEHGEGEPPPVAQDVDL